MVGKAKGKVSFKSVCMVLCFLTGTYTVCFAASKKYVSYQFDTNQEPKIIPLHTYVIISKNNDGVLVDVETLKKHKLNQSVNHKINQSSKIVIKDDLLICNYPKPNTRIFVSSSLIQKDSNKITIVTISILFISIFFGYYFRGSKKKKTKITTATNKHYLYEVLINSSKDMLTVYELDDILQIDKLSSESRKLKRHRLLNEINSYYPNLIRREKDLTDKRRYIYIINKKIDLE